MLCRCCLGLCCDGLVGNLLEQLLEQMLRVMEFRLDLFEHGKVLDNLLGERIDGGGEVGEGWQEARRAAGGLGRLLHTARCQSPGKGARIVVCRADRRPALSRRRSCACGGRHRGWMAWKEAADALSPERGAWIQVG